MARRKSLRHYTLFEANEQQAGDAHTTTTTTTVTADGSPHRPSSPSSTEPRPRPRQNKRRQLGAPSSPTTPSSRSNEPQFELALLPADILLRVAEYLQPEVSPFAVEDRGAGGGGGPSNSASWLDAGEDVMAFSSTCRSVWMAVREVVGRRFVLRIDEGDDDGFGALARLRSVVGMGEARGLDESKGEEWENANTAEEDLKVVISLGGEECTEEQRAQWKATWSRSTHRIAGARIRHLVIHTYSTSCLSTIDLALAQAIRSMPRLETAAIVYASEDEIVSTSPYTVALVGPNVLVALSKCTKLRELYLSGMRRARLEVDPEAEDADERYEALTPAFKHLTSITINASHDTALQLVNLARSPRLKEVKVWRDFARSARIPSVGWWSSELWRSVEHVELRGFSGAQGRGLNDAWRESLATLRAVLPTPHIPLQSLRLHEAYQHAHFTQLILPTLADLPHLTSFACMVWRDRHWNAGFLGLIARVLGGLRELSVGVENEGLNWWPGSMTDYGAQLALFPHLHTFTWNYTMYAEIDFLSARKTLYAPAVQMASRAGRELQCIRWIGEEVCLVRGGPGGARWRWSDEVPPVARSGLRFGRAGGVDENMPPAPVQVGEEGNDGEEREEEEEESKPRVKARKQLFAVGAAAAVGAGGKGKGKGKARMMDWEDDDEREEGEEIEQDSGFFEGEAAR